MTEKRTITYAEKVFKSKADDSVVFTALRGSTVKSALASAKIEELRKELAVKAKELTKELRAEFAEKAKELTKDLRGAYLKEIKAARSTVELVELSTAEVLRLPADVKRVNLLASEEAGEHEGDDVGSKPADTEGMEDKAPAADEFTF